MTVSFNLPLPVLVLFIFIIICICRCFTQPNCLFLELSEYRNQPVFQPRPKFQSIKQLGQVYIYSLLDRIQTDADNDINLPHLTNPSVPSEISDPDSCSICLDNYQCGDEVIKIKCGHIFHTECLEKWNQTNNLNPTVNCPLCNDLIYSRV